MLHAKNNPAFIWTFINSWRDFDWEIQGFGMLRTYLTKDVRLHIWFSSLKTEQVSTIHNHPWDFTSLVLAGCIANTLFVEGEPGEATHDRATILCGANAEIKSVIEPVRLRALSTEEIGAGQSYEQTANEIHDTKYLDGTVTLIERHPKKDPDHARVYWERGGVWVDAKPRKADPSEVGNIIENLLAY